MIAFPRKAAMIASLLAFILSMALMASASAGLAYAEDSVDELNKKVEQTANDYNKASQRVDDLNAEIEANERKLAELESKIDSATEESARAAKNLYIYQRNTPSLITLVFSSKSPSELFKTIDYMNEYEDSLLHTISASKRMKADIEKTNEALVAERKEAEAAKEEAAKALEEAKAARKEAMARAAEQAKREAEAEKKEKAAKNTGKASPVSSDEVNWNVSKSEFIKTWTPRIDAYLSGSPLAGQGKTFATAAWNHGVDPRWSPAISYVESSRGLHCFREHNAWGWGSSSWGSWEEAIDAHVAGLARIYGSTLTYSAAKKYCPPNYEHWYKTCLEQMRNI
ncbi:MAG: hypothetical protein K6G78_02320 [bacterium]|nr:hypothetical protein [bacterium]